LHLDSESLHLRQYLQVGISALFGGQVPFSGEAHQLVCVCIVPLSLSGELYLLIDEVSSLETITAALLYLAAVGRHGGAQTAGKKGHSIGDRTLKMRCKKQKMRIRNLVY